jgi:hypothetical protein
MFTGAKVRLVVSSKGTVGYNASLQTGKEGGPAFGNPKKTGELY